MIINIENIERKIIDEFKPIRLELVDESAAHVKHAHQSDHAVTHITIKIKSSAFDYKTKLERHRMLCDVLKNEIKHIHAISFKIYDSEQQWV